MLFGISTTLSLYCYF